jgi:hypothetical protein
MERAYPNPGTWAKSPQVRAILKAANPSGNRAAELAYMNVTGFDGYVENRDNGRFLGPFVDEAVELGKLPASVTKATQASRPAASAPPRGSAAPDAPRADIQPLIGARVRGKPNANPKIAGKDGVIEKVPDNEFGDFHIRMGGRVERLKRTLFDVIEPPDRSQAPEKSF